MDRVRGRHRGRLGIFLLLVAFVVLAGCGGGTSTSSVPNVDTSSTSEPSAGTSAARSTTAVTSGVPLLNETWAQFTTMSPWSDGQGYGEWSDQYGGYGTVQVIPNSLDSYVLSLAPKASVKPAQTHAALVTSKTTFTDFDATIRLLTVAQLRTPTPNPWEVAWILWRYTDDSHFYSLNLKPNGWELGKEDPAYPGAQRYLRTGSSPIFPIGNIYTVRIVQVAATMTVYVNGKQLVQYDDRLRPYGSGSLGLYCEDSSVNFGDVTVLSP